MEKIQQMLSTEDCTTIIRNYLKREDIKVQSHSINSLSASIEGFLGEHFVVKIEYVDGKVQKTHRCFMKILNGSVKTIFEMSKSLNAYEKEEFFYTFLLREFEKYDIDVSFAPQGYFCKPYLIVLEDLSLRGFKGAPKTTEFFDMDHCKAALKVLARFHSTSILFENAKSKELGSPYNLAKTYPKMFEEMLFSKRHTVATEWFNFSLEGIYGLIEVIPENHVKREDFIRKLKEYVANSYDFIESLSNKHTCTILHGDLWSNNFLFKYEEGVPVDSTLLDYQLLKYGSPSQDVVHMILTNTRKEFRDKHFNDLVEHYYKCINDCLPNIELKKVLPKNEYLQLCNDLLLLVKIQCLCDRCITFMPQEMLEGNLMDDDKLRYYLFEGRCEAIVSCFNKGGPFRELIEEDLLELRDMLFKNC